MFHLVAACETLFYIALSFIFLHEMDAVRCHEWRIFPGLSALNERVASVVFMIVHLPLYGILIGAIGTRGEAVGLIRGLDVFFVVHLVLHLLFLRHPKNEFRDWLSWTAIIGAGVFGGVGLAVSFFLR